MIEHKGFAVNAYNQYWVPSTQLLTLFSNPNFPNTDLHNFINVLMHNYSMCQNLIKVSDFKCHILNLQIYTNETGKYVCEFGKMYQYRCSIIPTSYT